MTIYWSANSRFYAVSDSRNTVCVMALSRHCLTATVGTVSDSRNTVCVMALSRHCLTATVGTVLLAPFSRCSCFCSSIDFGYAISGSLDLAGLEDACRLPADLCRGHFGMLFVVALASQRVSGCEILVYDQLCRGIRSHAKYMSKQTPPSIDRRQA